LAIKESAIKFSSASQCRGGIAQHQIIIILKIPLHPPNGSNNPYYWNGCFPRRRPRQKCEFPHATPELIQAGPRRQAGSLHAIFLFSLKTPKTVPGMRVEAEKKKKE
jgi:hypothetical protein